MVRNMAKSEQSDLKPKKRTISIGYKTVAVLVLVVVLVVVALISHKRPATDKLTTKSSTSAGSAQPTPETGSPATMQIVSPSSASGNVTDSQGSASSQAVYSATLNGTKNICNGKQVAASATGCTANGGVIFGNKPQLLDKQGQDTTP
jgi:hypothetical protein